MRIESTNIQFKRQVFPKRPRFPHVIAFGIGGILGYKIGEKHESKKWLCK